MTFCGLASTGGDPPEPPPDTAPGSVAAELHNFATNTSDGDTAP